MNKKEAIKAMVNGEKVTHTYFSPNEWMTVEGGKILTEEGYRHNSMQFWSYRKDECWNDGYSIWQPSKIKTNPF